MACAVALYLVDSSMLLYGNEGIVTTRGRSGWRVAFGSGIELRGRDLHVPAPLFPHRPVFRLTWDFAAAQRGAAEAGWTALRAHLKPLTLPIWGTATGLFVLLPLGLFTRLGDGMLVAALVVLYASVLAALAWLAFARARLNLKPRRLAQLAFEALVCPPFALNLARKLSAEVPIGEDLVSAARRLLPAQDWAQARDAFLARVDEEMALAQDDAARLVVLQRARRRLLDGAEAA